MASTSQIIVVAPGAPARMVLEAMIEDAQEGDRLRPVTVAVPSNFAGLHLRRCLSARPAGLVNVRFMVLPRLAELLGAPRLSHGGMRPLTPWQRHAAIAAALREHPGVFKDVVDHPATVESLDTTFRELRQVSDGAIAELARRGPRPAHVVALYWRFREFTSSMFDAEDLAEAAAAAVAAQEAALDDVGHVIFYEPRSLSPGEAELFQALRSRDLADAVLLQTGELQTDAPLADLIARLGHEGKSIEEGTNGAAFAPPPARAIGVGVDLEEEARLLVRQVAKAAREGTDLYRIGVLYSLPEYGPLIREQFRAAGIACNGAPERSLAQSVTGRTLLACFSLADPARDDFRREAVMRWLSQAPILERADLSGKRWRVPVATWEAIARDASVVRGVNQWRSRLRAWLAPQDGWPLPPWRIEAGDRLLAFVEELNALLQPPAEPNAAALATRAEQILERYLGSQHVVAEWRTQELASRDSGAVEVKDNELEAYKTIRHLLSEIRQSGSRISDPFASLKPAGAWGAFGDALTTMLERPGASAGRFGDGAFLGPIGAARGLDFELLFIAGMSEGALPPALREDPLLTDEDREETQIPLRANRRHEARADYLIARLSAANCVLSYPRSALRDQGEVMPSRWLLEELSALNQSGREETSVREEARDVRPVSAEDLEKLARKPVNKRPSWLVAPASFHAAIEDPGFEPASEQEYLLRSLMNSGGPATRHYLCNVSPGFLAGVESASVRLLPWQRREQLGRQLGAFQGGVGGDGRLAPWLAVESTQAVSPTSLEEYATCAYRYFLRHVLRVDETENPDERLTLEAKERGNIVHEALEEFLGRRCPTASHRWSKADHEELRRIAEEKCDERVGAGLTGAAIAWESERRQILRDLDQFLSEEELVRIRTNSTFLRAEAAFGLRPSDGSEPWPEPEFRLADGRRLRFRGKVDRVDDASDRVFVYDYKTGKSDAFTSIGKGDDPVVRGTKLQLAVYALAARRAFDRPQEKIVEAYYWFVSEAEGFKRIGYEFDPAREARFGEALQTIASGIESGLFPPVPGKFVNGRGKNCSYCPYDRICPRSREQAWDENKLLPELARLRALVEPASTSDSAADLVTSQ